MNDVNDTTTDTAARAATVAVIGLGPMGQALARAHAEQGRRVIAWNRTPGRAEGLPGVAEAPSAQAAIEVADVAIVVLRDHAVARSVLGGLDPAVVAGVPIVHASSGTPEESRETARWAASHGLRLISAAIMVPTPAIGTSESLLLFSGDRDVFDAVGGIVAAPGAAEFVGDDPGAASLLDVAMLDIFFAGITAFTHAAAMASAGGRTAAEFLPWAESVLDVLRGSFAGLARDLDAGSYPGDEDRLAMDLAALEHVVATSDAAGLDGGFPRAMRDLAARAVDAGGGGDGFSRIVEALRAPARRAARPAA